jgi:uncharacterized damage-inducible protein DinB
MYMYNTLYHIYLSYHIWIHVVARFDGENDWSSKILGKDEENLGRMVHNTCADGFLAYQPPKEMGQH